MQEFTLVIRWLWHHCYEEPQVRLSLPSLAKVIRVNKVYKLVK
jgi:hypothetical protein